MEGINPAIINRIRAQQDVGPDAISHVHHLPKVPGQREPDPSETFDEKSETPAQKPKKLSALFRTALRGGRRKDYDSTTT